jgi:hypothetical protein
MTLKARGSLYKHQPTVEDRFMLRSMPRPIVTANPVARRRAAWILVTALLFGLPALALLSAMLRHVSSAAVMRRWLWAAVALACGGALAAGSYLAWLGYRIRQAGQFPLPDQVVIRDTPVRQGRAAAHLSWLAWACAVALWAGGIAIPVLIARLLRSLAG